MAGAGRRLEERLNRAEGELAMVTESIVPHPVPEASQAENRE